MEERIGYFVKWENEILSRENRKNHEIRFLDLKWVGKNWITRDLEVLNIENIYFSRSLE